MADIGRLDFEKPDEDKFPFIRMAYDCLEAGPYACLVMNAANEVAVDNFLTNQIGFGDIISTVQYCLGQTEACTLGSLEDIMELDKAVRMQAQSYINSLLSKTAGVL